MPLSFISRVVCLAFCSAGVLQILLEFAAWSLSPFFMPSTRQARSFERRLFFLTLCARGAPWLLVGGALLPAYVRGEDNHAGEHVSTICIGWAAFFAAMCVYHALVLLRAWYRTSRWCAGCQEIGRSREGLPILLHPGKRSLMAVAGVFSSRIIVSQPMLNVGLSSPTALEVAFAHERAHARHRDNLKRFLLGALPRVPLATQARPSLQHQWRLAAEMAADEEGVQDGPVVGQRDHSERRVLLAEMLVTMAREGNAVPPQGSMALFSSTDDLRLRVDRLLESLPLAPTSSAHEGALRDGLRVVLLSAGSALMLAGLCYACIHLGHSSAEFLFHLS